MRSDSKRLVEEVNTSLQHSRYIQVSRSVCEVKGIGHHLDSMHEVITWSDVSPTPPRPVYSARSVYEVSI